MNNRDNQPIIHCTNHAFFIFEAEHAKLLRSRRIICQIVAVDVSTASAAKPPYSISHYAARLCATNELARFVHLKLRNHISIEENRIEFSQRLQQHANKEKELHITKRMIELRKHNVPITPQNLGDFDQAKMRLTISGKPDNLLASYDQEWLIPSMIESMIDVKHCGSNEQAKMQIYYDLYGRGFYISSGLKFGTDFLAYMGDPVRYHAQFAIKLVACDRNGCVDLTKTDINSLNCLQRLTHTANKIPLFATVIQELSQKRVNYWTLKERVYLNGGSKNTELERVEPWTQISSYEQINKIRKIS